MVLESPYRGFMAPVFAPLDKHAAINPKKIADYAKYLAKKGIKAVLVNGTVGEGVHMTTWERKKLLEAWVEQATRVDLLIMVHVGVTNLSGIKEMAQHAENLGVSSLLCMPDIVSKPETEEDLVNYLKIVGEAAPKTPLFYYHYPGISGVRLDMVKFLELGYTEIPTLAGIKYTDVNIDESFRCTLVQNGAFTVFLGCDQLIAPALFMGFDSFIPTTLNFASDVIFKIQEKVRGGNKDEAMQLQTRITNLATFVEREMHWINGFKKAITIVTGVDLGAPREPLLPVTKEKEKRLKEYLKKEKFL